MSERSGIRVAGSDLGGSAALPLTALIDVIFLVVIFFMINAVFAVTSAINVKLPEESGDVTSGARMVVVIVDAAGLVYVDDELVHLEQLGTVIGNLHDRDPELSVFVGADASLPYQRLIDVIGAIRDAGIRALSLLTEPSSGP